MRFRPAADVGADEIGGRLVRRDFALANDERCAEIAEAAEQVHRFAERVEDDFERDDVAFDRRDATG